MRRFLASAADKNVESGLVRIEDFADLLRDLVRLVIDHDKSLLNDIAAER
ncbi:MAG: hypothetical protein OXI87_21960 [Albidovulum sp.]|nr:hypothetical protein [Albidovulum sp.]MDE0307519.1 hypothetical protein [Albidovulum sp.]MDE0530219.1 hypothetical protein [Albidovulum sp.]